MTQEPWLERLSRGFARQGAALVIALVVFLSLLGLGAYWDGINRDRHLQAEERRVLEVLSLWRGRLESALNTRLHLVHGLEGLVHAEQASLGEDLFLRFAEKMAGDVPAIRSLQLAPEGVVRLVWPLENNRGAIGHDLLGDPVRRAAAEQAIAARRLWIAGPLQLIQGGVALIGRHPIFLPTGTGDGEQFWGFATILIDFPGLIRTVGLPVEADGVRLALRGKDGRGNDGEVFFGDPAAFTRGGLSLEVVLPAGSWTLAGMPTAGWDTPWQGRQAFGLAWLFVSLLLAAVLYRLLRMPALLRARVQEALHLREQGERRFQDAFESMREGFAVFDANDRLVLCNERFRKLYDRCEDLLQPGRTFEEIMRRGVERGQFAFVPDPTAEQVDAYMLGRMALHRQPDAHFEEQLDSGQWLQVVERPMRDGGTVTFHIDITDAKRKEGELVEARKRAEVANAAKSAFLATVSHEVRTPLNSVIGLLGLICEADALPARERERANTAHRSARHLLEILNEILDISKMEEGRFELESGPFCPAESAREVIRLVSGVAEKKGLGLELTLEGDGLGQAYVLGDEGRFRQVLLNLVSNAVKFTDEGRVDLFLRSKGARDGRRHLEIVVMDTGIGFDQAGAEKLFEPFSQLENHAGRRFGGTGLGLAICRRLISLMGGEIQGEGRHGSGAVFTVKLFLPHVERTAAEEAGAGDSARDTRTPGERGWRNVRVLLVEDSLTNQLVFEAMMEGTGYLVDKASSGEEALEMLRELSFDLVMMDVFMPGMDGLETTRALRQLPGCGEIPVIALTANAMQGDRERFLDAGMDDYLPKPIDKQDLLELMARWTARVLDDAEDENGDGAPPADPKDAEQRGLET